ncbi:MAG: transglutaminase domain-containing protein [Spirochaetes bacterium]|nr:transglutaminase domain-containing protein [Spirochaetota bacterium]MBN2770421.1 transglutaminase domain-containing protein [Spirochaetota bacterium]
MDSLLARPALHKILIKYLKQKPGQAATAILLLQTVYGLSKIMEIRKGLTPSLFFAVLFTYPLLYIFLKKRSDIISSLFFKSVATVSLYMLPAFSVNLFTSGFGGISYFSIFSGIMNKGIHESSEFITLISIATCFFTLITALLIHLGRDMVAFIIISIPAILIILNIPEDKAYTISSTVILTTFTLLAFTVNSTRERKNSNHLVYHVTITLLTVFIPVIILTRIFSASGTAALFEDIYKKLDYAKRVQFSQATAGFSEKETELGGPVKTVDKTEFFVDSPVKLKLRGSVKLKYTGTTWETHYASWSTNVTVPVQITYLSNNPAFTRYELTVTPEESRLTTYMTPLFTQSVESDDIKFSTTGIYKTESEREIKDAYKVVFYHTETDLLEQFTYSPKTEERTLRQIRLKYSDYLLIPKTVTDRTRDLALEIAGTNKNYSEIAKSIEAFLNHNYTYTTDASHLPPDHDFVDFFLFSDRKGYCTYFATAAVILLRINGIPSRYVEGFETQKLQDAGGRYIIKSAMAHAWCEVLIDPQNDIWAVFDPSPSSYYSPSDESYWKHFVYDYMLRTGENVDSLAQDENPEDEAVYHLSSPKETVLSRYLPLVYLVIPVLLLFFITVVTKNIFLILFSESLIYIYHYTHTLFQNSRFYSESNSRTLFENLYATADTEPFIKTARKITSKYYTQRFKVNHDCSSDVKTRFRLFITLSLTFVRVSSDKPLSAITAALFDLKKISASGKHEYSVANRH